MSILARMTIERADGQRAAGRRRIRMDADRIDGADGVQEIVVHDLSIGGCSFSGTSPIAVGMPIRLRIAGAGEVSARSMWLAGDRVGCVFDTVLTPEQLSAALATSPVIWGDFPANERKMTPLQHRAQATETPAGGRWPVRLTALAVGAGLVGFWAIIAAIV